MATSNWTLEEDKIFETANTEYLDVLSRTGVADWAAIAALLPGKTPAEVAARYADLSRIVTDIAAHRVPLRNYPENDNTSDKKKFTSWTEDEHKLFLKGLEEYGKGAWKSISRNLVRTKNPTQVASHAQKYFLRKSAVPSQSKRKRRSSIHDIAAEESPAALVHPPQPSPYLTEAGPCFNWLNNPAFDTPPLLPLAAFPIQQVGPTREHNVPTPPLLPLAAFPIRQVGPTQEQIVPTANFPPHWFGTMDGQNNN